MTELLGDIFTMEEASSFKPLSEAVDEEVQHYRAVQSLSMETNPLVLEGKPQPVPPFSQVG